MTKTLNPATSMVAAAGLWSLVALTVTITNPTLPPLTFLAAFTLGETITWITYLTTKHPKLTTNPQLWSHTITQLLPTKDGTLATLAAFSILLFIYATHHIDTALATTLTSSYLPLFIILRYKHNNQKYKTLPPKNWVTLTTALTAASLVTLSQTGTLNIGHNPWALPAGLTLTAGAATLSAFMAHRFKLAETLHTHHNPNNPELPYHLIIATATSTVATITALTATLALEPHPTHPAHSTTVITLGLLTGAGGILFRHANLTTKHLETNSLTYLTPILAVTWLHILSLTNIHHPDYLTIGIAGIAVANTLLNTHETGTQPKTFETTTTKTTQEPHTQQPSHPNPVSPH